MPTAMVIDLSHYNTVTSFAQVKQAGIVGVIHKATEGTTSTDPKHDERYQQVIDADLKWGTYHFLYAGNIDQQVAHYLDVTDPDDDTLLALDHEKDASLDEVKQFLQAVDQHVGRKAILYSGHVIKAQMKAPDAVLNAHRLWLAEYNPTPHCPPGWAAPWLWQYSQSGAVAGIAGHCDCDAYTGTPEQLAAQWAG